MTQAQKSFRRQDGNVPQATSWASASRASAGEAPPPSADFLTRIEIALLRKMLAALGNPPLTLVHWQGFEVHGASGRPHARIFLHDREALFRLIRDPEFWFGEMYVAGRIDVSGDLVEILESVYRGMAAAGRKAALRSVLAQFSGTPRNGLAEARRNIHHHYDIGNDFYRLWLDERMLYTCAYFPDRTLALEQAQLAKMDHVCRKLWLKPGEAVVEAGCGWGALALHMARHYGVKVKAFNISREQLEYARHRAHAEDLEDRVEFIEDDYRNAGGPCDAFVSVGMLEHVGLENFHALGAVINRILQPAGRGLIHTIGRDVPGPLNAWIERRIFPGACPPTLAQMMRIFEPSRLSVLDVENLRLHYATTLEHWLARFETSSAKVEAMFDAEFVRAWRLYLAGSLAAFRSGDMQLFQVVFNRSGCNKMPWTRGHLYAS